MNSKEFSYQHALEFVRGGEVSSSDYDSTQEPFFNKILSNLMPISSCFKSRKAKLF